MAIQLTSMLNVQNAQSRLLPQKLHSKATSPLLPKTMPKNAHPANAAAVTVMAATAVNGVTVPSHRQTKPPTPTTPRLSCPCQWATQKSAQRQLKWSIRL
jgi:hypothetical protein